MRYFGIVVSITHSCVEGLPPVRTVVVVTFSFPVVPEDIVEATEEVVPVAVVTTVADEDLEEELEETSGLSRRLKSRSLISATLCSELLEELEDEDEELLDKEDVALLLTL